ncbi:MAG: U32 family peptidase [Prevotella sp.]|nr:U32 family peptidase [Prevotella sp.]
MTKLELLAPAKNLECGMAAIDHGADAVYIGASRFGARVAAGNSVDDIRRLCQYAHPFGAKVYVTVNTIIYDDELEDTRRLLGELDEAGVDAVLVQDMAIMELARGHNSHQTPSAAHHPAPFTHLSFHASTQTDNRTADKVRWLRDIGFSRVVLARELSVEEIADIHAAVPDVELEVFVHGALCVSYSGLCYASQHGFGRSANRGACAQFCRMKFDLLDADGRELEHQRHLLSLKDLNQSQHIEELIAAGATSFKIEGRLKDVSYVKNVVAAYSQRLDNIVARHPADYCRASRGHCTYHFAPSLQKTFNRGFTTYFLHGRQPDIFSPDTPKAMGEFVGTVKEMRRDSFNVAGIASFANGDGLCFINSDRELEGFRVNRVVGNRLYPHQMPPHLRAGMALYRNNDQEFERQLSRGSGVRRIPVQMRLVATASGFSLSADGVEVSIACEHQRAARPQRDNIVRQLLRLGDTIYECSGVELADDFDYFIPNSQLSELRRQWVAAAMGRHDNTGEPKEDDALSKENKEDVTAVNGRDTDGNIANCLACRFYGVGSPTAYEVHPDGRPLMQCRHCLRYSLGYCQKNGGQRPRWREPLMLRLADGRRFRLEFDCRHCQMNVYAGG